MARNFDGTNDYIEIADHAALTLSGPWSLVYWVRFGTMADTDFHDIMSWRTGTARPKVGFFTYGDNHASYAGLIELDFESDNRSMIECP